MKQADFDNSNKVISINGNMSVAFKKISSISADTAWAISKYVSIPDLTKNPYNYLGHLVKLSGKVYKIEQLPPDENHLGEWHQALLLAQNQNSPVGGIIIDFII